MRMQVVVETIGPLERKMVVNVPAAEIDQEVNSRLQKLTRTAKVDGFRPGKVPLNIIKDRFGPGVQYEAMDKVLRRSLQDALQQEKLQPAGTPDIKLDSFEAGKSLNYTATFEVFPTIELQPFSDLVVEKLSAAITDDDLSKTLEGMQKQQINWLEVDRAAADGDRVHIAFEGTIEGKPFDGGKADNMPLVLGSHSTISGFEDGIINAKKGQAVALNLTFPENYGAKELAGKPVQFAITVNKVEAPQLPSLDDAFAEKFGVAEGGMEKLHQEVKQTLEQQLTQSLRQKLKAEVMAKLADAYRQVDIPKALIQREAEHLRNQMQQQFAQYKMPQMPEMNLDMFTDRAKERVTLGLVVNEIIEREQLKAEPAKVRAIIEEMAQRYDHPEQVFNWYYHDKARLAEIEALAIEDQVVDKIMEAATVVEKPTTAAEILSLGEKR